MQMRCPNCGAENPDIAQYCGTCAKMLSVGPPPRSSTLPFASLVLTIALVLSILGFLLDVYFTERWVFDYYDYSGISENVRRAMFYSIGFGDLAAILGLFLIVQAFMNHRPGSNLFASIRPARFNSVKLMLVLAAILFGIYLFVEFVIDVLSIDLSWRISYRLTVYLPGIAWLIVLAALLAFALALRDAEKSRQ